MGIIVHNLPSGVEAVQRRHANIQNHDVRFEVSNFLHGIAAITSFTAYFPTGMRCQQRADTSTNDFMVVSYKNTESHKNPQLAMRRSMDLSKTSATQERRASGPSRLCT